MKGIRQIGNSYKWEIMVKGKRKSGTCYTLEEAVKTREREKMLLNAPINSCNTNNTNALTLEQAYNQMLLADWSDVKSINRIKEYIKSAVNFFGGDMPLKDIDTRAIDYYINNLRMKGNKNSTINRKISVLSKCLTKAYKKGNIDKKPYIEHLQEPKGRVYYLSEEQENKILEKALNINKRLYHIIITLIDTGMRRGELKKLKKSDIQVHQGVNVICLDDTKNGTARVIPLTTRAKESLEYLKDTSKDNTYVIYERTNYINTQWNIVREELNESGNPYFVPHILRHTCCTRLVQKGAPIKKVQLFMGHKNILTTMRYTHLCSNDIYDLTKLLEKAV